MKYKEAAPYQAPQLPQSARRKTKETATKQKHCQTNTPARSTRTLCCTNALFNMICLVVESLVSPSTCPAIQFPLRIKSMATFLAYLSQHQRPIYMPLEHKFTSKSTYFKNSCIQQYKLSLYNMQFSKPAQKLGSQAPVDGLSSSARDLDCTLELPLQRTD